MQLYLYLKNGIPEIEASETPYPGFDLYELRKVEEGTTVSPPLKTTEDIRRDFPGTSFVIVGRPNAYECRVLRDGNVIVTGLGTTIESAEDTAWHGVKITLRDPS